MRIPKKTAITVILLITIAFVVLGYFLYSGTPFASLDADEIEEITVYAIHPDKELILNKTEAETVVQLLRDFKISKPGYGLFMFGLGGQTVTLTIQQTDGSTFVISNVGNTLITIDNMSYQADYSSAKAISDFANKVLETGY